MLVETEFIIRHHMRVWHDPSVIDATTECPERLRGTDWEPLEAEEKERFHRMYQALTSNPQVLRRIMLFCALQEHDSYVEGSLYGEGKTYAQMQLKAETFVDIILQSAACLQPEDQTWLSHVTARYQPARQDRKRLEEALTDARIADNEYAEKALERQMSKVVDTIYGVEHELQVLEACFSVEYVGYSCAEDISEHKHQ